MDIKGMRLLEALREIAARTPFMSDWRKLPNGRLVRFIDWGAARRGREPAR